MRILVNLGVEGGFCSANVLGFRVYVGIILGSILGYVGITEKHGNY